MLGLILSQIDLLGLVLEWPPDLIDNIP